MLQSSLNFIPIQVSENPVLFKKRTLVTGDMTSIFFKEIFNYHMRHTYIENRMRYISAVVKQF